MLSEEWHFFAVELHIVSIQFEVHFKTSLKKGNDITVMFFMCFSEH